MSLGPITRDRKQNLNMRSLMQKELLTIEEVRVKVSKEGPIREKDTTVI